MAITQSSAFSMSPLSLVTSLSHCSFRAVNSAMWLAVFFIISFIRSSSFVKSQIFYWKVGGQRVLAQLDCCVGDPRDLLREQLIQNKTAKIPTFLPSVISLMFSTKTATVC